MFRINWVELENFRSFLGLHKWVLTQGIGLFQITGRNDDNPRLDKNGIGKSSLLDAISWCLFGKTTRGLRGPDVVNDDSTSCSVCVNLDVGAENLTIKTTQNPNSLVVNGHISDREQLIKRLRLNHEAFLYSVITPQFGDSFLELTPSLKLSLFSQIMELEYWITKSIEAQELVSAIETGKILIEKELSSLKGRLESTASTIENLKVSAAQISKNKSLEINQLEMKKAQNIHVIEGYTEEIKNIEQMLEALRPKIENCEKIVDRKHKIATGFDEELTEANKETAIITYQLSQLNATKSRLKGVGSVCPTCNQTVDEKHLTRELAKVNVNIDSLTSEMTELCLAIEEIKRDKNSIITSVSKYKIELNSFRLKESSARNKKESVLSEIKYLKREISDIDNKVIQVKAKKNEFDDLIKLKEKDLDDLKQTINSKDEEISRLNEEHAAASFWVSGFKRLRLYIVEEALQSLEIEVNNNLELLGMVNWTIQFDVERETKSGGISKGFNVFITNHKGKTTKFEKLSGGEDQRIILAAAFGLSNLIMERAGLICKTEFYDEISQHLTDTGVDDTLLALKERAIRSNKQIWIIDHRSTSFSDFDGILTVINNDKGSHINTEQ